MNCTKCGRPKSSKDALVTPYELCCAETVNGDESCEVVAAAFRRGAEAMREACIAEASKLQIYPGTARRIFGQIDVNRAVREEMGNADA